MHRYYLFHTLYLARKASYTLDLYPAPPRPLSVCYACWSTFFFFFFLFDWRVYIAVRPLLHVTIYTDSSTSRSLSSSLLSDHQLLCTSTHITLNSPTWLAIQCCSSAVFVIPLYLLFAPSPLLPRTLIHFTLDPSTYYRPCLDLHPLCVPFNSQFFFGCSRKVASPPRCKQHYSCLDVLTCCLCGTTLVLNFFLVTHAACRVDSSVII